MSSTELILKKKKNGKAKQKTPKIKLKIHNKPTE